MLATVAIGACHPRSPAHDHHALIAGALVLAAAPAADPDAPLAIVRGDQTLVLREGRTAGDRDLFVQVVPGGDVVDRIAHAGVPAGASADGGVVCATEARADRRSSVGAFDRRSRRWRWHVELPGEIGAVLVGADRCLVRFLDERNVYRERQLDLLDGRDRTPPADHRFMDYAHAAQYSVARSPDARSFLVHAFIPRSWKMDENARSRWEVLGATDLVSKVWFYAPCAWYDTTGTLRFVPSSIETADRVVYIERSAAASRADRCPHTAAAPAGETVEIDDQDLYLSGVSSVRGTGLVRPRAAIHSATTTEMIADLAPGPDLVLGPRVVTAGSVVAAVVDGDLVAWDLSASSIPRRTPVGARVVGPFASPDGATIAVVRRPATLVIWSPSTGERTEASLPYADHATEATMWSIGLGPAGDVALTAGEPDDNHARLWARTGSSGFAELPWDGSWNETSFAWTTTDRRTLLLALDPGKGLHLFDLGQRREMGRVNHHYGQGHLALSLDGRRAAFDTAEPGSPSGVFVIDLPGASEHRLLVDVPSDIVHDIAWVDDHTLLVARSSSVARIDVDNGAASASSAGPGSTQGSLVRLHGSSFGVVRAVHDLDGVPVVHLDGAVELHFGFVPGGWYALHSNGSYACADAGCSLFRCLVDGEARPADDTICAAARVDARDFTIDRR